MAAPGGVEEASAYREEQCLHDEELDNQHQYQDNSAIQQQLQVYSDELHNITQFVL